MVDSNNISSAAEAASSSGLPQLDASTYPSQVLWLVVAFAILYFFMSKVSLPKIAETMHDRKTRIASDLKKAELLRKEAADTESDFTSLLKTANLTASNLINQSREIAAKNESKQIAKLDENFAKQLKEAELRLGVAKDKFQGEIIPLVSSVAKAATKKLINVDVDSSKAEEVALQVNKKFNNNKEA